MIQEISPISSTPSVAVHSASHRLLPSAVVAAFIVKAL